MKDTESVISLLQEEETMAPLYQSFRRVYRSQYERWSYIRYDRSRIEEHARNIESIEALRDAGLVMIEKAYLLQDKFPDEFGNILDTYREIFPQVNAIEIGPSSTLLRVTRDDHSVQPFELLSIAISEGDMQGYVLWENMSAGMRRTLVHLLEFALAPRGTVILVDEYENSMGINCLDAVTDLLLEPRRGIQLIITSHHPYVINNIPVDRWRVVTRHGSTVRIIPASEVPALNTQSKQDAFTRLLNATQYQEGIK